MPGRRSRSPFSCRSGRDPRLPDRPGRCHPWTCLVRFARRIVSGYWTDDHLYPCKPMAHIAVGYTRLVRNVAAVACGAVTFAASAPLLQGLAGSQNVIAYSTERLLDFSQQSSTVLDPSRGFLASTYLNKYLAGPWQGNGLFAFHGSGLNFGAHDMYIMMLGESGPLVALLYVGVLVYGIARQVTRRLAARVSHPSCIPLVSRPVLWCGLHSLLDSVYGELNFRHHVHTL